MFAQVSVFVLTIVASVVAQDASTHPYVAPGPNDVRSPCPGLNSLANHGFLPHSGKNVTLNDFVTGLKQGLNVGSDFSLSVGALGIQASPNLLATSVNLNELVQTPFPIQHDASLSRLDTPRDALHFNQKQWNGITAYFKDPTVSFKQASLARYNRVKECKAQEPDCLYGARQLVLSYGETALYLSTMGNPSTGNPPVKYLQSLFEKERLPYELGWTKPAQETTLLTLGSMINTLALMNPEILPEGLSLGPDTLRDVYESKDPITKKIVNAACLLARTC